MKLNCHSDAALLRYSKDELIELIFELRENINDREKNEGKLWGAISSLKQCKMIRDIWENCD